MEGISEVQISDLKAVGEEFTPRAEYDVSIEGDDSADGHTPKGAFRTIGHALNVVKSGEAVYILLGIYNEAVEIYDRAYTPSAVLIQGKGEGVILDAWPCPPDDTCD